MGVTGRNSKLTFPSRLCVVTCWMIFMSTQPWRRMWGNCRNSTSCIADSEWPYDSLLGLPLEGIRDRGIQHIDTKNICKMEKRMYSFISCTNSDCWRCEKKQRDWLVFLFLYKERASSLLVAFIKLLINDSFQRLKSKCSVLGCYARKYEGHGAF